MKTNMIRVTRFDLVILLCFPLSSLFAGNGIVILSDSLRPGDIYMACMNRMMDKMESQSSTISPEFDFLSQMVAHHQGAIEMADYEIRNGKNFEMIQLAKSIFQEQNIEINMMLLWLKKDSLPRTGLPLEYNELMKRSMTRMMDSMMKDYTNSDCDFSFSQIMLPHHQAAIDMAKICLLYSSDPKIKSFANLLISDEQVEIEQMSLYIK